MSGSTQQPFLLKLTFHCDLPYFLRRAKEVDSLVTKTLREKTSVKDVIESCGVPHPEVDGILVNGGAVDFAFPVESDAVIEVFPVPAPAELFSSPLQRRGITTFVADGHLGKLARRLRLLGLDVRYDNLAADPELVAIARRDGRALLTRDRRLLMHAAVEHGYCPRSQSADEQAAEIIARFDLRNVVRPYTRCATCNGELQRVEKTEVLDQLEPLTRIYYADFRRCAACGQVFWAGSHFEKIEAQLRRISGIDCRCEGERAG